MKFILSSLLVFLCVFAKAQVPPPMVLGGPQGIDVTRLLARNWMSTPIYTDTPSSPLTGAGWPGRGYLITVVRNETACQSCPPKDTTLWMYTGARWKRVGYDYLTRLVYGGTVSKVSGQNLRYLIQPYGAFFDGDYKIGATAKTATLTSKPLDSTSRIDVLVLNRDSFQVKTGIPTRIPQKPLVTGSEVEIASFYFKPFDSIPAVTIGQPSITNIFRVPGVDSIYYSVNTQIFAIKDSIGITKNDTAAMLNPYKFTAANGLTKDSTVFRLGGSLNQNTNINLNTRRLSFIGGSDTTRFFSNGRVSIGATPDSTFMLNVNGTGRFVSDLYVNSGRIFYGPASSDKPLIIRKQWAGGTFPGVDIGSNTFGTNTDAYRNSNYVVGDGNTVRGSISGQVEIFGKGNLVDSSFRCLVLGRSNTVDGRAGQFRGDHIVIGEGNRSDSYSGNISTSIVIGRNNNTNGYYGGGLFGNGLKYYENNQLAFGVNTPNNPLANSSTIKNVYFGNGVKNEINNRTESNFGNGPDVTINPSWANDVDSTNRTGGSLTIAGGRGTGTGTPGTVRFSTWNATTSGSTLHPTLTERARISERGNLLVNKQSQAGIDTIYRVDVNGSVIARGDTVRYVSYWVPPGMSIRGSQIGQNMYIDGDANLTGNIGYRATNHNFNGLINCQSINSSGDIKITGINKTIEIEASGIGVPSFRITKKDTSTWYFENSRHVSKMLEITNNTDLSVQPAIAVADSRVVCIGTRTVDTSSVLNVSSTTKGFLQPRMTSIQRDAITTPATGLQLFNTTDSANYVYRGTGGGWQKIANEISGSATLDFLSTNGNTKSDLTITVTGAAEGDVVSLGIPNSVNLNHSCFTAWVSNANEVTVRFNNYGTGALDPVSATFKVKVFK